MIVTRRDDPSEAEGWYRDPYRIHEDRWISGGHATKLVRDHGVESYDDPPSTPPVTELERVPDAEPVAADDLVRADDQHANGRGFDKGKAIDKAIESVFVFGPRY